MTSLEQRIEKYEKSNNMKAAGTPIDELYKVEARIIEAIEDREYLSFAEFARVCAEQTKGIRNPEAWAVVDEARETMAITGWATISDGFWKR